MYKKIEKHPAVYKIYESELKEQGVIDDAYIEKSKQRELQKLEDLVIFTFSTFKETTETGQ